MKILNQWTASLLILLGFSSCEEVIDLDLGNAAPRIVIEGVVTTDPGPYLVKINQSVDYGETNVFPPISGALVTVTDEDGFSELLKEEADGIYRTNELQGEHGKTYSVKVVHEEKEYTASSTIQNSSIPIQSVTYSFEEESLFTEEGYYITAFFADPIDEVNFYRLKVFVNGAPYYFEEDEDLRKDDNFWLINDQFFNGKIMDFEFPHKLKAGDQVDVELHQVDQATYDYYRTLVELMGVGGVAPSNPLTNWSNGALGYFGAISVTYASIEIGG